MLLPIGMWSIIPSLESPFGELGYTDVDSSWTLGRTTWCANCKQIIGAIKCQVATKTSPLHCNDPAITAICVWVCETQRERERERERDTLQIEVSTGDINQWKIGKKLRKTATPSPSIAELKNKLNNFYNFSSVQTRSISARIHCKTLRGPRPFQRGRRGAERERERRDDGSPGL
jgi:hypothetical protein